MNTVPDAWKGIVITLSILIAAHTFVSYSQKRKLKLFQGTLLVTKAMFMKPHSSVLGMVAGKIFLVVILFLGVVVFSYYKGGLLSKLAVKKDETSISTLEDVVYAFHHGRNLKVGTVAKGVMEDLMMSAPRGTPMSDIWHDIVKPSYDSMMEPSLERGMKRVAEDEDYIFMASVMAVKYQPGYPCSFGTVGRSFQTNQLSLGLQMDSPLAPLINYQISRLNENGVLEKIIRRYQKGGHLADCGESEVAAPLSFRSTFGIFFGLMVGSGMCLTLYVLELVATKIFKAKADIRASVDVDKARKDSSRVMELIDRLNLDGDKTAGLYTLGLLRRELTLRMEALENCS